MFCYQRVIPTFFPRDFHPVFKKHFPSNAQILRRKFPHNGQCNKSSRIFVCCEGQHLGMTTSSKTRSRIQGHPMILFIIIFPTNSKLQLKIVFKFRLCFRHDVISSICFELTLRIQSEKSKNIDTCNELLNKQKNIDESR